MKKFLIFILIISMIFLCSCEIHFGEKVYDMHWLFIAIPTVLILIISGVSIAKKKFVCPNCNKTFYVSWIKCIFSGHINDERSLRCPHCKKIGACYPSYNQEDEK